MPASKATTGRSPGLALAFSTRWVGRLDRLGQYQALAQVVHTGHATPVAATADQRPLAGIQSHSGRSRTRARPADCRASPRLASPGQIGASSIRSPRH
jgi:hypothetical protein